MDNNIKKVIEAIRKAGQEIERDIVLMDDREDRVIGYAIGEAFKKLASTIEESFTNDDEAAAEEAHRDGRYCGNRHCRQCNTYPPIGD